MGGEGLIQFPCPGNDTTFCFNSQATCSEDVGGEICICPEGFQHDYSFGHHPNCVLPVAFLPTYFAISTVGTVWAQVLFVRELLHLKKTPKLVMQMLILLNTIHWVHVLCVYVQNGSYEAAMFFSAISAPVLAYFGYLVIMMISQPVYVALKRPIWRWRLTIQLMSANAGFWVMAVLLVPIAFASDESQRGMYNTFVAIGYILTGGSQFTLILVCFFKVLFLERLILSVIRINTLNMASGSDKLTMFVKQLRALKKVMALLIFNSVLLVVGVVFLALQTMPYQFLIWAGYFLSVWPSAPFFCKFVRSRDTTSSKSADTPADVQKNIGTPVVGERANQIMHEEIEATQHFPHAGGDVPLLRTLMPFQGKDEGVLVSRTASCDLTQSPAQTQPKVSDAVQASV